MCQSRSVERAGSAIRTLVIRKLQNKLQYILEFMLWLPPEALRRLFIRHIGLLSKCFEVVARNMTFSLFLIICCLHEYFDEGLYPSI